MPQFIPVDHCAQAVLELTLDGQQLRNVLHFTGAEDGTDPSYVGLSAALADWWIVNIRPLVSSQLSLVGVSTRDLSSQTSDVQYFTAGLPSSGARSNMPSMPNSVTVTMSYLTNKRGRSYRGRTYHIGLVEADVTNNRVDQAHLTALVAAYDKLRTIQNAGGTTVLGRLCIASRYQNKLPRGVGIVTPVIAVRSDGIIDSQRRRLPGRGR